MVSPSNIGSVIIRFGYSTTEQSGLTASRIRISYVAGARLTKLPEAAHVVPPSIEYSYVPLPPVGALIVIVPSLAP